MKENAQGIIIILSRVGGEGLDPRFASLPPSAVSYPSPFFTRHPTCRFDSHRQIYRNFCFVFVLIFWPRKDPVSSPRCSHSLIHDSPFGPFNFSFSLPLSALHPRSSFIKRWKLILATLHVHSCVQRFN